MSRHPPLPPPDAATDDEVLQALAKAAESLPALKLHADAALIPSEAYRTLLERVRAGDPPEGLVLDAVILTRLGR